MRAAALLSPRVGSSGPADRHRGLQAHTAKVQATIPPSRQLTLDVREGREPCAFLGSEVPMISFPRLNSSRQFVEEKLSVRPQPPPPQPATEPNPVPAGACRHGSPQPQPGIGHNPSADSRYGRRAREPAGSRPHA